MAKCCGEILVVEKGRLTSRRLEELGQKTREARL
jgi:hypothetical protein